MSHPKSIVDDSDWPEVRFINGYAMLIGFLRMGVRGLSVLVFTWATVVLLGGFVSDLGKKDFWCLTMITLIQTFSAGVFDFLLKGKNNSKNSWKALLATASTMAKDMPILRKAKDMPLPILRRRRHPGFGWKLRRKVFRFCKTVISFFLWVVQLLVLATVLFPILVVYLGGLYISTGISLWRLIRHDSDNAQGEANREPALAVLYLLAVVQGALHSFKELYARVKGFGLVEKVAASYRMHRHLVLVSDYLDETMAGCAREPTFGRQRNLVTYAVDLLMESKSTDSYLSGIQILGAILELPVWHFTRTGQPDLIKQLLTKSASCGHMIQRLIETMGTGSPDSTEVREHAARIVAHVADAIQLRYFPGGPGFLSFLVNTVEDYRGPLGGGHCGQGSRSPGGLLERLRPLLGRGSGTPEPSSEGPESEGNWLVVQGLSIIQNLTTHEDNCSIIIKTAGLSRIAGPLISDQLHMDHHDEWSEVAEELLKLVSRLMATPGKSGTVLRQALLDNKMVISTLERIVACKSCGVLLIRRAIQILLDLSMDPSHIMDRGSSGIKFTWILLHIFLVPDDCFDKIQGSKHWKKKSSDISRLAGEMLSDLFFPSLEVSAALLLQSEGRITSLMLSVRYAVADLTKALVNAKNIPTGVRAAEILKHLCMTMDDEYVKELKKAMVVEMPKVLGAILPPELIREDVHASARANNAASSFSDIDLEKANGNAQENLSSSNQHIDEQPESRKLQEALVSLCKTIWVRWYDEDDSDVTRQLDDAAAKICAEHGKKSFSRFVLEAEERLASVRTSSGGQV